jgi:hypothetical protein
MTIYMTNMTTSNDMYNSFQKSFLFESISRYFKSEIINSAVFSLAPMPPSFFPAHHIFVKLFAVIRL